MSGPSGLTGNLASTGANGQAIFGGASITTPGLDHLNRDEDLPIDRDHLIPQSKFGFDWRYRSSSLNFEDTDENFRHLRGTVGNSIGNFRWLDASDNRGRQDGKIGEGDGERDIIDCVPEWNALIGKNSWGQDDVAVFQKMINLRTITIYEHLLITGGLKDFVTEPATTLKQFN